MVIKLTKYNIIYSKKGLIISISNSNIEFDDNVYNGKEFDSIEELEQFIIDNKLFDEPAFEKDWIEGYYIIRIFITSNDSSLLAYEVPEFILYLRSRNINLIFDNEINGQYAYLTEIEPDDKQLLEYFGAKFQYR